MILAGIFFVLFPFLFGVPWPLNRAIPKGHWFGGVIMFAMIVMGAALVLLALFKPDEYVTKFCPNCQAPTEQYLKKTSYSEKKKYWVCEKCRKKYSEPFELPTKKAKTEPAKLQAQTAPTTQSPVETRHDLKLAPSKFCRECGARISRDSMFCEECGARLT